MKSLLDLIMETPRKGSIYILNVQPDKHPRTLLEEPEIVDGVMIVNVMADYKFEANVKLSDIQIIKY